jgi:type IV secretion system protein VirB9
MDTLARTAAVLALLALAAVPAVAGSPGAGPWIFDSGIEPEVITVELDTAPSREAEIDAAVRDYRRTGEAPVLKRSDLAIFPFDRSQPVVRCSPLRACDVELQAGEVVTAVALGDAERWVTSPLESGDVEEPIPHVVVKPKAYDLATNLIVATDRRTYHLGLVSPPKAAVEAGEVAYHRHVAFYYPDQLVERWTSEDELRRRREDQERRATVLEPASSDLSALNFDYRLRKGRRASFAPTVVFDDGRHVYIQLPARGAGDLPALLVEEAGAGLAVANYRVAGRWIVVDGLFAKARLVVGVGRQQRKVEIVNRSYPGA